MKIAYRVLSVIGVLSGLIATVACDGTSGSIGSTSVADPVETVVMPEQIEVAPAESRVQTREQPTIAALDPSLPPPQPSLTAEMFVNPTPEPDSTPEELEANAIPPELLAQYPGIASIDGESAFDAAGNLLYRRNPEGIFEMVMSPTQAETVNAYHGAVDFGLAPKDGQQNYQELMSGIIAASKPFWQSMGVSPDYESVMAYLRSVGYMTSAGVNGNKIKNLTGNGDGQGFITDIPLPESAIINWSDIKYFFVNCGITSNNIGNSRIVVEELLAGGMWKVRDFYFGVSFAKQGDVYVPVFAIINENPETLQTYPDFDNYTFSPRDLGVLETTDPTQSSTHDQKLASGIHRAVIEFLTGNLNGTYVELRSNGGLTNPVRINQFSVSAEEVRYSLEP